MTVSASGVSQPSALDSARREFEVARLVFTHLPDAGAQSNRHLYECWRILLDALLLHGPSRIGLEDLSLREKLERIPADKMKVLSDSLGATWQERLGALLDDPSKSEPSRDMITATQKIVTAVTREREGESRRAPFPRLYRWTAPFLAPFIFILGIFYLGKGWKVVSDDPKDWFSLEADLFRIAHSEQSWGSLRINSSVTGKPLVIRGKRYDKGLGTHARSSIILTLGKGAWQFSGACGVDGGSCSEGTVTCAIYAGDTLLFESGPLRFNDPPKEFTVPVDGRSSLTLLVRDGGNGGQCDHADWVDLRVSSR